MKESAKKLPVKAQVHGFSHTNEEFLRAVIRGAPVILWAVNRQGIVTFMEGKGLAEIGLDPANFVGRTIEELVGHHEVRDYLRRAFAGEALIADIEFEGAILETRFSPMFNLTGEIGGVVGVSTNVTDRVKAEAALKERDRLIQIAVAGTPMVLFVIDRRGIIKLSVGKSVAARHHGSDTVAGHSIFDLYHDVPEILEAFQRALAGETFQTTIQLDGRDYKVRYAPLEEKDSHISGVVGIAMDVTEGNRSEEALHESELRFRTIFEGAGMGIELIDLEGRLLAFNPAICSLLGYNGTELWQDAYSRVDHPANIVARDRLFDELREGKRNSYLIEKPFLHKENRLVWGRLFVSLARDTKGQPQYAIAMLEDINERKQMEAEMKELRRRIIEGREAERLLLAQDLHDGPVQDLYSLTYDLKAVPGKLGNLELDDLTTDLNKTLEQVIQTLRSICGELRPPTLAPFGLEKAIRSHLENFRNLHPDLNFDLDLMPDGQILPEQIRLALFRIFQATLSNVLRHAEATHLQVRFSFDNHQVTMEIKDDGKGFEVPSRWIQLARQGHIGLVGAVERAEAIGGELVVESAPGNGTIVRVTAPYSDSGN